MDTYYQAKAIMHKFTITTGISPLQTNNQLNYSRRYLWTDSYAVCNYLSLFRQSAESVFLHHALSLIAQVHQTLGRHRQGSPLNDWLSGLNEEQARLHPTRGGLRIGKELDERQQDEPGNQTLEWQQDGQYFHYLTKWMHALNCVSRDTGNPIYIQWAVELAKIAHRAFVYTPVMGGTKRMFWKMSIDLSRPLVASMGQHDPLDGLLTYLQLNASLSQLTDSYADLNLDYEIDDMLAICAGHNWVCHDALGIGGLLSNAYKLLQLIDKHQLNESDKLAELLEQSEQSLHEFINLTALQQEAEDRLAFRELGLAIGLQAISKMQLLVTQNPRRFNQGKSVSRQLEKLSAFTHLHPLIENFWLIHKNQQHNTWTEHSDINNVMLATSLVPDGFLQLTWEPR